MLISTTTRGMPAAAAAAAADHCRDAILAGAQGFCAAGVFGLRPASAETPLLLRTYTTVYAMMITMMMPTMTIWCWPSTTFHLYVSMSRDFRYVSPVIIMLTVIKSLLILLFRPKLLRLFSFFFFYSIRVLTSELLQWARILLYLLMHTYTQYHQTAQ